MTNAQIAAALDELGDLYELDGAVYYRVLAYRTAASTVRESSVSVEQLVRDGRVTELPGIGKTLETKLQTLIETGDMTQSDKLRSQFPSGLIAMMHLPGFGPKRARRLYDELGIDSLDKLRAAAEAQQLRGLRGFGPKAEEKLLETLAAGHDGTPAPRWLLSRAEPVASSSPTRCAPRRAPIGSRSPARCGGAPTPSRTSTSSPPPPTRRPSSQTLTEHPLVDSVQPRATQARAWCCTRA